MAFDAPVAEHWLERSYHWATSRSCSDHDVMIQRYVALLEYKLILLFTWNGVGHRPKSF